MAKYNNYGVANAKELLVSRLAFVVNHRLSYTTTKALAERVGMSTGIISKVKKGICHHVSIDALLELAQRLNVAYSVNIEYTGKGNPKVKVTLQDIHSETAAKVRKQLASTKTPFTGRPVI